MTHPFKNIKGETIAETIIALSVLAIGVTIASTAILSSLRNMNNAKNRIIAVNLAREGLETMRNVRDSNWLQYSDRRRECWNHDPSQTPCEGDTPLPPGSYVIYRDVNDRFLLAEATAENQRLFLIDSNLSFDSNEDGDLENDIDFYNHTEGVDNPLGKAVENTNFRRLIQIEYVDNAGELLAISQIDEPAESINTVTEWDALTNEQKSTLNRMRITSRVEWVRAGITHHTELKTVLTDHLGRTELGT